jgi:HEAT repeat protein
LIAALDHPQGDVRRAAADVLARLGPSQIEPVARCIARGARDGRESAAPAAYALGQMIATLRQEVFYAPDVEPARFNAAAGPVVRFAAPALVALLSDERDAVRQAAQRSLAQMGILAMPILLDVLGSSDAVARRAAIETLVRLDDYLPPDSNRPQLAALHDVLLARLMDRMQHADPQVRAAAFRAFAGLSFGEAGQAALPLLRRALRDENLAVRRYASQSLREWDDLPDGVGNRFRMKANPLESGRAENDSRPPRTSLYNEGSQRR